MQWVKRRRWIEMAAMAVAIAGLGCTREQPGTEEPVVTRSAALTAPQTTRLLCEYVVYSTEATDIRDRAKPSGGLVGSKQLVTLGVESRVTGDVESGGNVVFRDRAQVIGNVTAAGTVQPASGAGASGSILQNTAVPTPAIPSRTVSPGTTNVPVGNGQTRSLAPGAYGDVQAFAGSTLTLVAGEYQIKRLIIESSSVRLNLDVSGGRIAVNVRDELRFGDNMDARLVGGTNASLVSFYSNQTSQIKIGTDKTFFGVVTAPSAEIYVFSRTTAKGALFGKRVVVDTDSTVERGQCSALDFLEPTLSCVSSLGGGQLRALFGYRNRSGVTARAPVGPNNRFTPAPEGRGQPTIFLPQELPSVFSAQFSGASLTWNLAGRSVTARATSPACPSTTCGDCGPGRSCVSGQCVAVCGDGVCARAEGGCTSCPADCGCPAGKICVANACATAPRCGIEWQCGSGTVGGVSINCGTCSGSQTCVNHVCL